MIIQDWLAVVIGSLQNLWVGSIEVLGSIIGAGIVFIIGLIVASGISTLIERLVGLVKLDKALSQLELKEYFDRAGMKINSGMFFGKIAYWFLVIVFLLAATDILGFYTLSNFLRDILLYIPNVLVAVLIMLAAVMMANFLKKTVKAGVKSAKLHSSDFLGSLTWWAVVVFGFFAALQQLGIAVTIINSLVTGFIAMLALAGGIAFGLGGKDSAASLLDKIYDHMEQ